MLIFGKFSNINF